MSYEHRSNVGQKRGGAPLKVVSVVVIILLALFLFAPDLLSNFFTKTVSPLWNIGKPSREELSSMALADEYNNALVRELQKENQSLKNLLNRNSTTTPTIAYILKKPPFSAYDVFIIDLGSEDGIAVGEKVFAHESILIGEVAEVTAKTSKVKLYSSSGEKFEALLEVGTTTGSAQVTATGRGGGSFEVVIPRDMKVKVGDTVMIPSLTTNVFGIVDAVVAEDTKTFSTVLFSQPINIYELKWLELYH